MHAFLTDQGFNPVWVIFGGFVALLIALASTLSGETLYVLPRDVMKVVHREEDSKLFRWTVSMWYLTAAVLAGCGWLLLVQNTDSKLARLSFLVTPPYAFLITGLIMLLSGIVANITGEAPTRFHKFIYRQDDPKKFWESVILDYFFGALLVACGFYLL